MVAVVEPPEQDLSLVHNTVVLGTGQGEEHIQELGGTLQEAVHIVVGVAVAGGTAAEDKLKAAEDRAWVAAAGKLQLVVAVDKA